MGKFGKERSFGGRSRNRSEAHGSREFNGPSRFSPDSDRPSREFNDRPREFSMERPKRPRYGFDESKKPLEMFDAICDKCGRDCQLPFRPRGDKPVYCRDCFKNSDTERPKSSDFEIINRKLDKIMKALHLD